MTSPKDITESNNKVSRAVAPKPIITSTTNSKNSHDSETEEGTSTTIATMNPPRDNRQTINMGSSTIAASPTASTPFIPPKGPCDVGDIISYNHKWMTLKSDGQWLETKGPDDFNIEFCGFKDADFFRYQDHFHGYRKQLKVGQSYTGYQRREENLDIEFEKYKIQHENEKILKRLSETMKEGKVIQHEDEVTLKRLSDEYLEAMKIGKSIQHEDVKMLRDFLDSMKEGKVKPKNVACLGLGSFERCGERKASFGQLAVLMKIMELLEIPTTARKVMQDPDFSPGDKRFLTRCGFEVVDDPQGFEAVNEETLVFQVGGYNCMNKRIMDRPWPAVFIKMGLILENRSKIVQGVRNWYRGEGRPPMDNWWDGKKKFVAIQKTYDYKEIPTISSIGTGIRDTKLFWKKEEAGGKFQWFVDAWRLEKVIDMTSFADNKKFGGMDIRVVTETQKDIFKTLDMSSPSTNGESKGMEVKMVVDSPATTLTDTPFSPPTGHWDIGDIIRYGDRKWMMLGEDNEWHEYESPEGFSSEGPGEFSLNSPDAEKIEFYREQEEWTGSGEGLTVIRGWSRYRRLEESALDAIFEKYKLRSEDEAKLRRLVKSMVKGKVKPTNVVCLALGSLHRPYNEPKRSFEQFAVLLKLMEILEISPNARNLMQDPEFCPRDARFFAKYGFETVTDPEGFNSINGETLVVEIGGYDYLEDRAMEGHWPAAFIKMGIPLLTRGHILERKEESSNQVWNQPNVRKRGSLKSFFEKEKVKTWWEYKLGRAFMKRSYSFILEKGSGQKEMRLCRIYGRSSESALAVSVRHDNFGVFYSKKVRI
ncbi:hypothetical protein BGAL_0155g00210 [Botrytis galanthina]|uniref:SRR1-like domain-containing protein n=1 Tax=Botrytis galanthina TaxID=278940 RepID=A0A4S8RAG5_9HELO|nr:hypothetical protein BGAL_0155g00210 [Botrytis galanthina]